MRGGLSVMVSKGERVSGWVRGKGERDSAGQPEACLLNRYEEGLSGLHAGNRQEAPPSTAGGGKVGFEWVVSWVTGCVGAIGRKDLL